MKWKNKGHEFDEAYQKMKSKESYYLFGAGDYGTQFVKMFQNEINIICYIDNDKKKQGSIINELECIPFDAVKKEDSIGIIVTMSQSARVMPIEQLTQNGYKKNEDYFIIEEFISVYNVYKYNKVVFSSISFLPATICNLKCKHCLNFNPYAKKYYARDWDSLVSDIDLFFDCVDYIMLFHVSGGEPLLYQYTADIISYIDTNYRDKIGTLRTVTNGTVVPSDRVLEKLSQCNVEITVDDYREAVPEYSRNFEELIEKLEQYGIKYYINKVDSWIDLAPERTDFSDMKEEQIINHRDACSQSWEELRDKKLYSCNYAAYAVVAGIAGEQDIEEVYDLRAYTQDSKKELIEFRLGFTTKGYTNFCKKCRGFTKENRDFVLPAIQCEG